MWAKRHYEIIRRLADIGCLMQVTAGSILGTFGAMATKLSQQMFVHRPAAILANEAPDRVSGKRPAIHQVQTFGPGFARRLAHRILGSG